MFRGIELATTAHAIIQSLASPCFRYGYRRPTARIAQNRSGGRAIVIIIIIISRITDAIHGNRRPTAAPRRRQTHGRRPDNCDYVACRHRIRQNVRFALPSSFPDTALPVNSLSV